MLETRQKVNEFQEQMIREAVQTNIQRIQEIKEKALIATQEWLNNFLADKGRVRSMKPSEAKTILSVAHTADQMGRLELGQATSHVAIAHKSMPQGGPMLESAMEKLKEIDPVFDYESMQIQAIDFAKERSGDTEGGDQEGIPGEGVDSEGEAF